MTEDVVTESLKGLRSLSPFEALEAGQPTAWVVLSDESPRISCHVVTKPVSNFFNKTEIEATYFWALLYVDGHEIRPTEPWSSSPQEAVENALRWWTNKILTEASLYASDIFPSARPVRDLRVAGGGWLIKEHQ